MAIKDEFGERMKAYEKASRLVLNGKEPIIVRIDGNSFSKYTKKMRFDKPFDMLFVNAMKETTKAVMERCSNTVLAYTQSDEITVAMYEHEGEIDFLGNRVDKICSLLASVATRTFNKYMTKHYKGKYDKFDEAEFDCRVFNVPSEVEMMNAILWRQLDCWKNCVGIVAHWEFARKLHSVKKSAMKMDGVSTKQKIEMLKDELGTDVKKDYDEMFHYGITFYKEKKNVPMPEEYKKHKSNKGKDFIVRTSIVECYDKVNADIDKFKKLARDRYLGDC